jgi:hypothetical protein
LALLGALGMRGWLLAAAAPAATLAVLGLGAVLAATVGLPWHAAIVAILASAVAASAWLLTRRRLAEPWCLPPSWSRRESWAVSAAVATAAAVIIYGLFSGLGSVQEIFWGFDAPFHYNAVGVIADTGRLTSDEFAAVNNYAQAEPGFYPPLFHGTAALLSTAGVTPVAAVNGVVAASLALVLPVGLVGLLRVLGSSPLVAIGVALCSAIVEALPFDVLFNGPKFPYATSRALIAPVLVLLVPVVRRSPLPAVASGAVLAASAAGLVLWHSSYPFSIAVFAVPLVGQLLLVERRWGGLLRATAAALGAGVLLLPWLSSAATSLDSVTQFSTWQPDRTPAEAIGNVLTMSHVVPFYESQQPLYPQWWVSTLVLLGVIAAVLLRPPFYWVIASWVVATGLFVITTSFDNEMLRSITAVWYNDKWRLWGLAGLGMILLAGLGLGGLLTLVRTKLTDRSPTVRAGASLAVLAVFLVLTNLMYVGRMADISRSYFAIGERVLTDDELRAYEWLADQPDADTWIMNEWMDGSAMMLALHGLRPVWGHYRFTHGDHGLLYEHFHDLETSEGIQRIIDERDIRYVVVGNTYPISGGARGPAYGLTGLDDIDALDLVWASRDTTIYRINDSWSPTPRSGQPEGFS